MNRDLQHLLRRARDLGATVTYRRSGHYRISSLGGAVVFTASTPSDHRTVLNTRAVLRRAGLPI